MAECLIIQLRQLPEETPGLHLASRIILEYFDLLAARDVHALARKSREDENSVREAIQLIQSLNPRPGNQLEYNPPNYVVPILS